MRYFYLEPNQVKHFISVSCNIYWQQKKKYKLSICWEILELLQFLPIILFWSVLARSILLALKKNQAPNNLCRRIFFLDSVLSEVKIQTSIPKKVLKKSHFQRQFPNSRTEQFGNCLLHLYVNLRLVLSISNVLVNFGTFQFSGYRQRFFWSVLAKSSPLSLEKQT